MSRVTPSAGSELTEGLRQLTNALDGLDKSITTIRSNMRASGELGKKWAGEIEKATKGLNNALAAFSKSPIPDLAAATKTITENTKASNAQIRAQNVSLESSAKFAKQIAGALKSATLNVQVTNKGFQKVLNEMSAGIERFRRRDNKTYKSNFFEEAWGTKKDHKTTQDNVIDSSKKLVSSLEGMITKTFSENIGNKLKDSVATAMSQGVKSGLSGRALKEVVSADHFTALVSSLTKLKGMSADRADYLAMMLASIGTSGGSQDFTNRVLEELSKNDKRKQYTERVKIRENAAAKVKAKSAETIAKFDILRENDPQGYRSALDAMVAKEKALAKEAETRVLRQIAATEKQTEREKKRQEAIEQNLQKAREYEEFMEKYRGKELTDYDKAEIALRKETERMERLSQQMKEGKINYTQWLTGLDKVQKATRKVVEEEAKVGMGYEKFKKASTFITQFLRGASVLFERISEVSGSVLSIFNSIRSKSQSLFRYLTNSVRQLTGTIRTQLSNAVSSGLEQYEKVELASIGFESFYGKDKVESIVQRIQQEAISAPALSVGDLSDYVMQLAPVSNGNSDLAINAALGILKTLQYGGSDASEMSYVVKNIRDVIAKGTAQAVDIRQFNRAMPALEQAIEKAGLQTWLSTDSEGNRTLKIDKTNAKEVLKMFADLNTGENSPVKDIFDRTLTTLSGLKEAIAEQRNATVSNILSKSGLMDRVKSILDDIRKGDLGRQIENFFISKIQKVISFLDSVDWQELGHRLEEGWSMIRSAIRTVLKDIATNLGVGDGKKLKDVVNDFISDKGTWNKIWTIVSNFLKGLGEGIKQVATIGKWILENVDLNMIANLAGAIGYIVSPMGKIISTIGGMAKDASYAFSRTTRGASEIYAGTGNAIAGVMDWAAQRKALMAEAGGTGLSGFMSAGGISGLGTAIKNSFANMVTKIGNTISTASIALPLKLAADGLTTLARQTKFAGDATDALAGTIDVVSGTLTGAAIGASFGGIAGGFIGAVGAAALELAKLAEAAEEARTQEYEKEKATILDETKQTYYDKTIELLKAQGVDVDTGSAIGKYASDRMKKWLNEEADLSQGAEKVATQAADKFTQAIKFKQVANAISELSLSDTYAELDGAGVDLNSDRLRGKRDKLADAIRNYRLLGDDEYDPQYSYLSNEDVIKRFLGGDSITEGQLDMYLSAFGQYEDQYKTTTTDLSDKLKNVTERTDKANGIMTELNGNVKDASTELFELNQKYGKPASNLTPSTELGDTTLGNRLKSWDATDRFYGASYTIDGKEITHSAVYDTLVNKANELANELNEMKEQGLADTEEYKNKAMELSRIISTVTHEFVTQTDYTDLSQTVERIGKEYNWFSDELKKRFEKDKDAVEKAAGVLSKLYPSLSERLENILKSGDWKGAGGNGGGGGWSRGGYITPVYRATGGDIRGVDTVPAMLQPGEFVVRKSAVERAGLGLLSALNRGDMMSAARSLGTRFGSNSWNNSRNWNNTVNNNQKNQTNYIKVVNRNLSRRMNSYYGLANRIALA